MSHAAAEDSSRDCADVMECHADVHGQFSLNEPVEAQDDRYAKDGKWYKGRVVELDAKTSRIKVHFNGFHKKWDLWLKLPSQLVRKPAVGKPASGKRTSKRGSDVENTKSFSETVSKIEIVEQKTPVKQKKPSTTPSKVNDIAAKVSPVKKSAAPSPSQTRRSMMQTELSAEASPPPAISTPQNYNENNAISLAPATLKPRKVLANTFNEEKSPIPRASSTSPVPKRAKLSPKHSPHESLMKPVLTPTKRALDSSPRKMPLKEPAKENPKPKLAVKSFDSNLVDREFYNMAAINADGVLHCKAPGCSSSTQFPHMMKYHIQVNHADRINRTNISQVVVASKQQNAVNSKQPATIVAHYGSMSEVDVKVNCVCKSNVAVGFLISCSMCNLWQHGNCIQLSQSNPPSIYSCHECIVKPQSAAQALNPVLVTTITPKQAASSLQGQKKQIEVVPAYPDAFTVNHSIDTYRSVLKKITHTLDAENFDLDKVIGELKALHSTLVDKRKTKVSLDEMRKNIDNLILKI